MKLNQRNAQLQAAIMASMLVSNIGIKAEARQNESGEWYIQVVGNIPPDYKLAQEVAGIKILHVP